MIYLSILNKNLFYSINIFFIIIIIQIEPLSSHFASSQLNNERTLTCTSVDNYNYSHYSYYISEQSLTSN